METSSAGDEADPDAAGGGEMELRVNGDRRTVRRGLTVAGLLDELGVDRRRVAVEHNRRVVPREEMEEAELEAGDELEIVQFVGGGR